VRSLTKSLLFSAMTLAMVVSPAAYAAKPAATLTSLREVHALTNEQASRALPASFEATVTFFRSYENTMFVQDGNIAVFVTTTYAPHVVLGDRVLVKGVTHESFRPIILGTEVTVLHHGATLTPVPADYDELIRSERDCALVKVHARVRSADMVVGSGGRLVSLQLLADGRAFEAEVDSDDSRPFNGLLDAEVEITGVVAGKFDGKMQQTGIVLHTPDWSGIKVLKRAGSSAALLPVTPMDQVLMGYHVQGEAQRIKVHGAITYFQPGTAMVLQDGARSLWIQTHSTSAARIGDLVDVSGFPGLHDGFLTLTSGEVQSAGARARVTPAAATWSKLVSSKNVFDLVSIEGRVVTQVREAAQDEYVLMADGQMFSAIYRHQNPAPPMRRVEIGSTIRVTGICMMEDSNPINPQVTFTILMRNLDDISVVAAPPLLSVKNLLILVGILILVVFAVGLRSLTLERKVRRQTAALAARIEADASLEHHQGQIEQQRGRILEDISGSRPLEEILEQIVSLASFRLDGAHCWCEVADGARVGSAPANLQDMRIAEEPIPSRSGAPLGTLFAAFCAGSQPSGAEMEALALGTSLAALAIENRRLYTDLVHRSEFDLLTDLHNRFSLDKLLETQIETARLNASIFGIIYIDLDNFKQINDVYGHHIGDLYLQEVAVRMKQQLRSHDLLARLGGDEFTAMVAKVPGRAGVEEIAQRLERSLDEPFVFEGYTLRGAASVGIAVYPEDGITRDSLLSAADAAMYVSKHTKAPRASDDLEKAESLRKRRK